MRQGVLKKHDLNPDGVRIVINWDNMTVGSSVFVPCVDTEKATKQVDKVVAEMGWDVKYRVRIEDNKLGLRIWRFL
tara:strand:+ start:1834 stop:2061 length:228 start_codon:yes stop_codon:yes gene_type:complete